MAKDNGKIEVLGKGRKERDRSGGASEKEGEADTRQGLLRTAQNVTHVAA